MVHRAGVGLTLWALLPLWLASTAFANDQQSIISLNSQGPETRIVSNATDLGEALQAHEVTNIIIRGRVHLKKENWVAKGTAVISKGRHVVLQSEHVAPASAVLDFGLLTDAIHVAPDAHLEFQRLHVPNSGNRKLAHPTPRTRLHVAGAFALWPSVTLAKGSQMSMHDCVFYYWSDEQWDSCDKFREAATLILNPNGVPNLLDWRASGTQVSIKGVQRTTSRLVDVVTKEDVGTVTMTRTNHTLVCVPDTFQERERSPRLLVGALSISFTLLAAAGAAWYVGMLDFNFSRESRQTNSSGGSTDADGNKVINRSTLDSLAELLRQRERATIGGLELGELLGRGSFGRVYKGRWCGGLVAVKIVAHNCALSSLAEVLRESALSTSIQHPNVVTTFKVRTVRSRDGVYTNPVSTWLHGMDNDLDSIAGSHQELLNKALSQAGPSGSAVSGDKNEKPEKRSQSLLASMRQAKDSGPFDPPPLKSFRSVPPQVPTGGSPKGMEQQDSLAAGRIRSLESKNMDADEPDAFQNLLARLKQSQHMHMIADTSEKSSKAAEDLKENLKDRCPGEGLRPSDDSARPYKADDASGSQDMDDVSDDGSDTAEPLTMEHKAGCRQWPPYQHRVVEIHPEDDDELDDEPQPLTRDIKGGALSTSLPERSSTAAAFSAFRPPPSPFRAKQSDAPEGEDSNADSHAPLLAIATYAGKAGANNAFADSTEEASSGGLPPRMQNGHASKGTVMSYSPGAEEQHKGELKHARQHGVELLETWLILEYCDCGSLEDATLEGKYRDDLKSGLLCLMDIAAGMEHLHSMGVLHGDLKGANVLLKSAMTSAWDPRGYVCKLADFGLSRVMEHNRTHVSTATFGTAAYMPAELLLEGKMTKAADVYGFSMLAWELFTGEQLFQGLRQSQVICKVMTGWRPPVPENLPEGCANLLTKCWSATPSERPSFAEALQELRKLVAALL